MRTIDKVNAPKRSGGKLAIAGVIAAAVIAVIGFGINASTSSYEMQLQQAAGESFQDNAAGIENGLNALVETAMEVSRGR